MFSSPFLGTFFQFVAENHEDFEKWKAVFVPFLGDLFSMMVILLLWLGCMSFRPLSRGLSFNLLSFRLMAEKISRFRPLSWGLSFNGAKEFPFDGGKLVFVPFLGDFFSMYCTELESTESLPVFVPFLGDFFSICSSRYHPTCVLVVVFVPFLGDFFSIRNL